jgi:hypothetical protein
MARKDPRDDLPGIVGDNGLLSWLSALVSIQRGWSYLVRPPHRGSVTENVIDRFVPYTVWGWLALAGGALILVGFFWVKGAKVEIVGHICALTVCSIVAFSVILSAVFLGQPWAASGGMVLIAVVHLERIKVAATRRLGGVV